MTRRDYYMILGVSPEVSQRDIKDAFRSLARQHHPDHAGVEEGRRFREIVEAYEVLGDARKRRDYDRSLGHGEKRLSRSAVFERAGRARPLWEETLEPLVSEPVTLTGGFDFMSQPVEALFERFARNFTGVGVPKAEKPESLTVELVVSPLEAMTGGIVDFAIPAYAACPACRATGGQGLFACRQCHGAGIIQQDRPVRLTVRPGVADGEVYNVPLAGLGIKNLYLRVIVRIQG